MEAGKRTINDIFNGNKILEIPFFQRAYVWDTPQWERFLSDMEHVSSSNKPYFLGSVILKQQLTDSLQSIGDKRTVIDGQQRLTTLIVFFKVLSLKTQNSYLSNLFRLPMKNNEIALLHNHNNAPAFNSILNLNEEQEIEGEDNVTRAYRHFCKYVDPIRLNFQNILTNIMFVGIDLGIDENEQQIFDTINSLGVKLTTAELLKNYFFGRTEVNMYTQYWKNVFEKDNDAKDFWDTEIMTGRVRRQFIDLFFYAFLQIKVHSASFKINSEDKDEFTRVEGLFDSYKKFIHNYGINKLQLVAEIKDYAEVFRQNFDLEVLERELSGTVGIDRINAIIFGLENTTLVPYVLYIMKNVNLGSEREEIFGYLEAYIMRRMVCHANTKNYNQLFGERFIANSLQTGASVREYIEKRSDKVNYMPSDDELKEGFLHSKLTNKQAAGVLYLLESKIRDRSRHSTSLLGINRYSLEHIMPKKWENHWGKVSDDTAKVRRNRALLTLGNLTIITASLNSSIRDASWTTKKSGKAGKLGLTHYAAALDTFSYCLTFDNWDENTITTRAQNLFAHASSIWRNN